MLCICTDLGILRQYQQSVVACTGVQILSQSQLGTGTQHTAGLIAAQLAFFDLHGALDGHMIFCGSVYLRTFQCYGVFAACMYVVCTTTDLQGLCAAYIYLTYM